MTAGVERDRDSIRELEMEGPSLARRGVGQQVGQGGLQSLVVKIVLEYFFVTLVKAVVVVDHVPSLVLPDPLEEGLDRVCDLVDDASLHVVVLSSQWLLTD